MKFRTSILLLSLLGALPAYADQASIAVPEGSTAFKNAFGTSTSTFDDVLHYALNPALKTLASNFGGTSCTSITVPTQNQWCVDINSRTVKMYSPNGSGVYAWNTALVINSDGSLSPSNLVAGAVSSVAGRSGSVLLTSSDLTDSTTLGRGLVGASNAAAAKALLAITASDVANLAPSAVTDTTNASNIGSGTLAKARLPSLVASDIGGLAASATTDTTNASNLASGTVPTARLPFSDTLEAAGASAGGSSGFDNSTVLAALAPGKYVLGKGIYRVAADATVAKGVVLDIRPGSSISVDTGKTLTVHGSITSGVYTQIFTGAGSVIGTRFCRPEWFGASGTFSSGHDDQPAFQACMTALAASAQSTTDSNGSKPTLEVSGGFFYFAHPLDLYPTNTINLDMGGAGSYQATIIAPLAGFSGTGGLINVRGQTKGSSAANMDFSIHDINLSQTTLTGAAVGLYFNPDGAGYAIAGGLTPAKVSNVSVSGFPTDVRMVNTRLVHFDRLGYWGSTALTTTGVAITTASVLSSGVGDHSFSGDLYFTLLHGGMDNSASPTGPVAISIASDSTGCTSQCAQLKGIKIHGELSTVGTTINIAGSNGSAVGDIWVMPGTQLDGVGCNGVSIAASGSTSALVDNIHIDGTYFRYNSTGCNDIAGAATGSGTLKSVFINGNWFANPQDVAVNMSNVNGMTINNNQVYDAQGTIAGAAFAISLSGSATFSGNAIHKTGSGTMGSLLNIAFGTDYLIAAANVCGPASVSGSCIANNSGGSTHLGLTNASIGP